MSTSGGDVPAYRASTTVNMNAHSGVLGVEVVEIGRRINGQDLTDGSDKLALYQEFDDRLQQVRENLTAMTTEEQARFAPYVRSLMGARLPASTDAELVGHLTGNGNEPHLVHFLNLNVGIVEHQQMHGQGLFSEAQQRFVTETMRGIGEGWISQEALDAVDHIWDRPVRVGDFAMTHLRDLGGFYDPRRRIVIAQGIGPTELVRLLDLQRNLIRTFDHEGNHALFEEKFSEDLRPLISWFTESMAEHLHLAKQFGRPELFRPAARWQARIESGVYEPLRNFVDYAITAAPGGPVDPLALTRAYTARTLNSPEWQKMEEQLDRAWGSMGTFWAFGRRFAHHMAGINYQAQKTGQKLGQVQMYYEAARRTHFDLIQSPQLIFGANWQKPPRQNGGAV